MRILFISNDLIAGNVAYLLKKEGHDVKLFIQDKKRRNNFDFLVDKTYNWKEELSWVGKDGLIVFDDTGYGRIQDKLRKQGYRVFGGTELGDKTENDREYGQEIFEKYGLKTVTLKDFDNMDDAVEFVKKNPKAWVIKQNEHAAKNINYVGQLNDGQDVISVLRNYLHNQKINKNRISLHERVEGVEIGVGRYFNGNDWVGPIEINLEHKRFLAGDLGPTTSEMGTIAWYDENEDNKLFKEVLSKLKPFLQEIKFKGDFEINCIVNNKEIIPLEATSRFGSPIVHLHSELHVTPWGELLSACADGKNINFKYKKGYGIVIVLAVPPFPYSTFEKDNIFYGITAFFNNLTKEEMSHVHFEEIARDHEDENRLYISDCRGYVAYVTAVGETVEEAREIGYSIVKKIVIPKVMYRNDIGVRFIEKDQDLLKKWGYIK